MISAFNAFLETLEPLTRLLFVGRYWFFESYQALSVKTGLKEGAIRTKLSRSRADMIKFFKERGLYIE